MSLGRKIFLVFITINFVSMIVIQGSSYFLTSSAFKSLLGGMQSSLGEMQKQTDRGFQENGREAAQNLIQLIKISVGESLQPGESDKFLYLAKQLSTVKGLAEFSFFGPDGLIELSSIPEAKGRKITPQVWEDGKRTRQTVVSEDERDIMLYEPLYADADMIRFHPDWESGKFYGMLFVKISKERQNRIELQANQTIQNAITNGSNTYAKSSHQVFWVILSIICASMLLMAAIIGLAIRVCVTRPLAGVAAMLKDIAQGEGDLTRRIKVASRDEIGDLAKWFNAFVEKIQLTMREVSSNTSTLASSSTMLSTIFHQMQSGLKGTSAKSSTVAAAAEEMSAQSSSVATEMDKATNSLTTVATATKDMSVTIADIATNSERALTISQEANSQANHVSMMMKEFEKEANEIGRVTETINKISSQTNLLALNATIEAARAGAAGKGFSVVASEIKNLAQQTAEATEDIKEKISGIQNSSMDAIANIEKISKVFAEVHQIVASIAAAIEQQTAVTRGIAENIARASVGVNESNGRISLMSSTSQSIAQEIADVDKAAAEMSTGSEQILNNATELSKLGEELRQLVSRFKV